jgi:uncharacterized membrane protein YgcG
MRKRRQNESGFALLLVFLMAAILAISLYKEIPRVAFETQRQKELLLIERGEQYKRAIQLFYRDQKRMPNRLEDLENTNNKHYLRKRYVDPMTGKDEWRVIKMVNGVLVDSKVQNAKNADQKQGPFAQSIGEVAGMGQTLQNQGPTGVNPGLRRRGSDNMAAGDPNNPGTDPGGLQAGNLPPGMTGPTGQTGIPGQPPVAGIAGMPGGAPGMPNVAPGMPGGVPGMPGGVPGMPPQPGMIPVPGQPGTIQPGMMPGNLQPPGMPPGFPGQPGQTGVTGRTGMPGMPGNVGTQANSGGTSFVGSGTSFVGGGSSIGTQGGNLMQPRPVQPGPGSFPPGVPANSQNFGGAPAYPTNPGANGPTPGGFGQPGMTTNPQAQNAAAQMIGQILTQPRPGGMPQGNTGGVMAGGTGIVGFASTADQESIIVYNDQSNYGLWEFIFDPAKQKVTMNPAGGTPGTPASQIGQPMGQPIGQPMNSPFGGQPGGTPFGGQPAIPGRKQ